MIRRRGAHHRVVSPRGHPPLRRVHHLSSSTLDPSCAPRSARALARCRASRLVASHVPRPRLIRRSLALPRLIQCVDSIAAD